MQQFKYSSLIDAPVEVVWNFHERQDILQLLTPPWQPVQIVRREGGLNLGAISEFRLFVGPIPIRWLARHTEYEQYHLFSDEQIAGPFASWTHRHQFATEHGKTRLTDAISFSMLGGEAMEFIAAWFVVAQLDAMFRYRHEVTRRECELK
ncbi:MAG: SRPBCC family protein [Nostocaceae cyanobacterium]|nr:SRPBCC family protein [Nostocaceae cyanobacterium]